MYLGGGCIRFMRIDGERSLGERDSGFVLFVGSGWVSIYSIDCVGYCDRVRKGKR